ncbi:MAG: amidohydrolase family protein, partial [Clostridia bacterium]|nr:amidohydrolase family protein [Clostridia bacterium]
MENNTSVLYNGKIYMEKGRYAQALLIEDGVVKAVGSNEEVLPMAAHAEQIDLGGKTVIPGLIDSHMHLYNVGKTLLAIRLFGSTSMQEVIDRSCAFIEKHQPAPGSVVVGRGWNHDYFTDEKRMPNRFDLDKVSTEHAIIITRTCGHMLSCNTKAIEMAGITASTPQIEGGEFELGADGQPNGIFKEHAMGMIQKLILAPDYRQSRDILKAAMAHASSH